MAESIGDAILEGRLSYAHAYRAFKLENPDYDYEVDAYLKVVRDNAKEKCKVAKKAYSAKMKEERKVAKAECAVASEETIKQVTVNGKVKHGYAQLLREDYLLLDIDPRRPDPSGKGSDLA